MGGALYARAALGILSGLAASLLPWPVSSSGGTAGIGEVALLSPRGFVRSLPTRVVWSTALPARRVRVRIVGDRGERLVERSAAIEPDCRVLPLVLAGGERSGIVRASSVRIELALLASSGELLAWSPPARFTLRAPGEVHGW